MQTTTATPATPIAQLRDNAKRLEAALSVGVANPSTKAVHELRSATRRVEAQIELLGMIHGLPPYKPAADKVLRRLAALRRKAGRVRDCDVQQQLLKDDEHQITAAAEAPRDIAKTQKKLDKRLSKARKRGEHRLLAEVDRQLPKLARDTEALLAALKPAKHLTVPVSGVLREVQRRMDTLLSSNQPGEEHLHQLRKAAKRARYQCESIPGPQAAAAARRFESLQDAGGSWHDLLDLATVCHRELGPEHPLSRILEHLRDEYLDKYLRNIEDFRATHAHRRAAAEAPRAPAQRKPPRKSGTRPSPTPKTRRRAS